MPAQTITPSYEVAQVVPERSVVSQPCTTLSHCLSTSKQDTMCSEYQKPPCWLVGEGMGAALRDTTCFFESDGSVCCRYFDM